MSELRRGRRLRDIPQQMNGMGAAVPGTAPEAEVRPVRSGEAEADFQLGEKMGAQAITQTEGIPTEATQKIGKGRLA